MKTKNGTSLFMPNLILPDVTQITAELLKKNGIRGIALDVDNTLTAHGSQELKAHIKTWLDEMKKNKLPMIIVSNNTKKRITPFAKMLGLPFISMSMKPLVRGFIAAQKKLGFKPSELAIVGDQIFTDVLGGNRAKMFSILVTPISADKGFSFKIRRRLEKPYIKRYQSLTKEK